MYFLKELYAKYKIGIIAGLLCMILVWGGYLRMHKLGADSLWIDEGYTINAAQATLEHGYPILESGEVYDAHLGSTYTIAASMKLFGFDPFNPWSARLPQAIAAILAIYFFFRAAYQTTRSLSASIIATVAFTFLEWHIGWSRQARGYAEMQLFLILAYSGFLAWFNERKNIYFILGSCALGIATLFQGVALVTLSLILILPIVYYILYRPSMRQLISINTVLIALALFTVVHRWIFAKLPGIVVYGYEFAYLLFTWETFWVIIALTLLLLFLFWKRSHATFLSLFVPLTFLLIPLVIIAWYSPVIQYRYLLVISPFIFILLATGLSGATEFIKDTTDRYLPITLSFIIGYCVVIGLHLTPVAHYPLESGSPQPDFKSAYELIHKTKSKDDIVIAPYTQMTSIYLGDPGYWLPVSLTGRSNEITDKTFNGTDYYTGAPKIDSPQTFKDLIATQRGYIVLDAMARARVGAEYLDALNSPRVTLVFRKATESNLIELYHFN